MSVTVQWDDESCTILRYTYMQRWTWADYEAAVVQAHDLVNAIQDRSDAVDVIADFSESTLLPDKALANFRTSLNRNKAISFRVVVIIIPNQFLHRMLDLFGRLYGNVSRNFRTAANLDEAHAIIGEMRNKRLNLDDTKS
ncbi:MAG: hypothetical protein H7Y09_11845 [Chitinophagaceae bacterium]|nr:hypothetical protein [Anaerolineae bacterium]